MNQINIESPNHINIGASRHANDRSKNKSYFFAVLCVQSSLVNLISNSLLNTTYSKEVFNKRKHNSKPKTKINLKCKNLKPKRRLKIYNQTPK
jgi:hypothetical protein